MLCILWLGWLGKEIVGRCQAKSLMSPKMSIIITVRPGIQKMLWKKLFSSEISPPSPSLPPHFFICLKNFWNLRNAMPYQTLLSGRIVEDAWSFSFFLPSIADERPRKEKSGNVTANVLYVLNSLWNFGTPHQDLCIVFIVWVLPSFSNTWLPSSSQLSHELCYFLHLSVSHCFITDVSRISVFCCNRFHNQERQGNFLFKEEF